MVKTNYALGLKYFSYRNLEEKLWHIVRSFDGLE